MQISPITAPAPTIDPQSQALQPTEPKLTPIPEPAQPVDPAPQAEPSKLISMLASGHFNAVAALRLRMNHADQIAASGVQLPEPPAAVPHGKAYQKVLAAYKASAPTTPAPTPEPAPAEAASAPTVEPAPSIG